MDVRNIKLTVNGELHEENCSIRTTLLDFLRHNIGLTGTHSGCEHGVCGACTIELSGKTVRSCLMFAYQASHANIRTVEGLSKDGILTELQSAFKRHHALQCGFCTPGFLMAATELIAQHENLTLEEIRANLSGNICRCTGYVGIVEAVFDVFQIKSKMLKGDLHV